MPRISDAERDARRSQILNAARACVAEHGLEAVSMQMIIDASGVSVGAVYRYFKGKDEVIAAAFVAGTVGMIEALEPVWAQRPLPALPDLVGQVLRTIRDFGAGGPVDLSSVAVHGWSHSQSDADLQAGARRLYGSLRDRYLAACREWQADGRMDAAADPVGVAELLFSVTAGFTAQRVLVGNADIDAHVAALRVLGHLGIGAAG